MQVTAKQNQRIMRFGGGSPGTTRPLRRSVGILIAAACALAGVLTHPGLAQAAGTASTCSFSMTGLPGTTTETDVLRTAPVSLVNNCPAAAHYTLNVGFTAPNHPQGGGQLHFSDAAPSSTLRLSVCHGDLPDLVPDQWTSTLASAVVTDSNGAPVPNVQWVPTTTKVISDISAYIASARRVDTVVVNGLFHGYQDCNAYRAPGTAYLQRYLHGGWQNMIALKHNGFVSATIFHQTKVVQYRWADVTPTLTRYSASTYR